MRRSEITQELIELSKRAKKLGFPQDVERGLWIQYKDNIGISSLAVVQVVKPRETIWTDDGREIDWEDDWFLILEFSRCLEWLEDNNKGEMIGLDLNNFIHGHWIMGIKTKTYRGKNIHEVGAKAMVKILEGD